MPGAQPAAAPSASAAPQQSPMEQARRAVVIIERSGRAVGLGFALAGDGRIVTALSVLGDGNGIDVRYADGSLVDVRVGHGDRVWDLALLVPQVGRWSDGLRAGSADPLAEGSRIKTFTKQGRGVRVATLVFRGRTPLLGGDGEVLRDALEITSRIPSSDLGAPLVDGEGRVVGLVSRACKPDDKDESKPCRPVAYGAPLTVLRQFLRSAPANATPPSPWLGIQGVAEATPVARGVKVVRVQPGSPAAQAGLRDGAAADVILAVDGTPVQTAEKLAELVRTRAVGDEVQLILFRGGKFQVVPVTLRAAPSGRKDSP